MGEKLMDVAPSNWMRLTASNIVDDRAVVLYGVQAYSLQTGDTVIIYDGQNANAPIVFTMDLNEGQSKNLVIDRGLLLVHGLYVGVGANITEVTVFWRPYEEPVIASADRPLAEG